MLAEVEEKGVIFLDTDSALREHPDLVRKYFGTLVPYSDNKYAALNTAVWSGGSFIYVPKGVKLEKPLQSYFRINSMQMGQFERTLIIVDEGADVHYVEGCTAPQYSKDSLHAAIVEIFVHQNARCRYSTVQNWSDNIINLVTKRARVLAQRVHGMDGRQHRIATEYEISGLSCSQRKGPRERAFRSRSPGKAAAGCRSEDASSGAAYHQQDHLQVGRPATAERSTYRGLVYMRPTPTVPRARSSVIR